MTSNAPTSIYRHTKIERLDYGALTNLLRQRSDASIAVLRMGFLSPTPPHIPAVTTMSGLPPTSNSICVSPISACRGSGEKRPLISYHGTRLKAQIVQCPHCLRTFSPRAAPTHVTICANVNNRPRGVDKNGRGVRDRPRVERGVRNTHLKHNKKER